MLDLDEIRSTLLSLPDVLDAMLSPIDDAVLRTRPDEGEWCPLEVIGHLIACDGPAFRDRISAILDGDGVIGAFRPWDAINARDLRSMSLADLLDELRAERAVSAAFVEGLAGRDLATTGALAGETRRFAAGDFLHEWSFHDHDHLQQILGCTKRHYPPHMTDTMRAALGVDGHPVEDPGVTH